MVAENVSAASMLPWQGGGHRELIPRTAGN